LTLIYAHIAESERKTTVLTVLVMAQFCAAFAITLQTPVGRSARRRCTRYAV
jgi:hypothetical protein